MTYETVFTIVKKIKFMLMKTCELENTYKLSNDVTIVFIWIYVSVSFLNYANIY